MKTGKVIESTRTKEIKVNPPIDASFFASSDDGALSNLID